MRSRGLELSGAWNHCVCVSCACGMISSSNTIGAFTTNSFLLFSAARAVLCEERRRGWMLRMVRSKTSPSCSLSFSFFSPSEDSKWKLDLRFMMKLVLRDNLLEAD